MVKFLKLRPIKGLTSNGKFLVRASRFLLSVLAIVVTFVRMMFEKNPSLSMNVLVCALLAMTITLLAEEIAFEAFTKKASPLKGVVAWIQRRWPPIRMVVDGCGCVASLNMFAMACLFTLMTILALLAAATHV